jgi:hypothetical protein
MKRIPLAWVWVPQRLGPGGVVGESEISRCHNSKIIPAQTIAIFSILGGLLLGSIVGTIAVFNYRTLLDWTGWGFQLPVGLVGCLLLVLMAGILIRFLQGRIGLIAYAFAYFAAMCFFESISLDSKLLVSFWGDESSWIFINANYLVVILGTVLAIIPIFPPNSWFSLPTKAQPKFK